MDTSWAHSTMGYALECMVPEEFSNKTISSLTMDLASREASRFALLLYIANPNATTHQNPADVPDYFSMIAPNVITLMITEIILRGVMTGVESYRLNDLMASLGSAVIFMTISAPTRSIEVFLYEGVFAKRLFTFDWDSPLTWWIAALTVDFLFYWFHRFAHETNIGWAGHQVHHGSEDYNLTASIRQSAILKLYTIIFYLPLAYVGVPLPAVLVHMQLNIIYQLWLHTELVSTLGPLEWIFNTPSHHRVHHGSEPWCLDKNYAGVLIIWDRMFGTFQPEIKDKKIIYGLVDQPQSMNSIYLETFYYKIVYDKFKAQTRWIDRCKALFYGPGWSPGSPRLGHPLPEPPADQPRRKKYDPQLPRLLEAYLLVHFLIAALVQQAAMVHFKTLSGLSVICHTCYALSTMAAIGGMYDGWSGAMKVEALRCTGYLVYSSIFPVLDGGIIDNLVQAYLALSIVVWSLQSVSRSNRINWERKLM